MLEFSRQDTNEAMNFLNKFWKYIIEAEKPENKLLIGSTNRQHKPQACLAFIIERFVFHQHLLL